VLKLGAIALLVIVGFGAHSGSSAHFTASDGVLLGAAAKATKMSFLAAFAVAMSKVLFSYDAWNTVTFAAEEIRNPSRNLPRALVVGSIVTIVAYLGAASVYLYIIPMAEIAIVPENRIAASVAEILLGHRGVVFVIVAILISTFGCVNGLILGGGRVLYAMARDGIFFRRCGKIDPRWQTPAAALTFQGVWSVVLALTGTYSTLLTYTAVASLGFNFLTVTGLIVMRRRYAGLERPYRVIGYPFTPILYLLGTGLFILYLFIGAPRQSALGLTIVLVGIPFYFFARRRASHIHRHE
jgi:Amino acid transporters